MTKTRTGGFRAALVAATAMMAILSGAHAQDTDPDAVIGTVAGREIRARDLDFASNDLDQQISQLPEEQRKLAALSALIDITLLAGKADEAGLGNSDAFKARMDFLRSRALHNEYFQQEVLQKVTEADVRARYDKEIAASTPENEVRASHILVKTKEEAEAIIKDLDGGADFATIAKEKSTDPGSGAAGGDLGYFTRGRMVPEFEQAAFALEPGAYTKEPVQSQFGFHVIRVDDKRAVQPPAFEQVREQVEGALLRERYFTVLADLRKAAAIDIKDPALKAAYDAAQAQQAGEAAQPEAPAQ